MEGSPRAFSLDSSEVSITQGLTSFTFSPFDPTAAHLLNLRFGSGEKFSRKMLKVGTKRMRLCTNISFAFAMTTNNKEDILKVNN